MAVVCGKRSFSFENELETYHYPSFKKHRCSSYSPFTSRQTLLEKLQQTFPLVDTQLLDRTLEDCNFDVDVTINTIREIILASSDIDPVQEQESGQWNDNVLTEEDGLDWVDLFVQEMTRAENVDDAKTRAAKALAARDQERIEAAEQLKELNLKLSQENCLLKRAVVIQHERLKGLEEAKTEVEKLSGMLSQCREELRISEMNNYAMKVHIGQANIGASFMMNSTNLPPDVY